MLIHWRDGSTTLTCADSLALYRVRYGAPTFMTSAVPEGPSSTPLWCMTRDALLAWRADLLGCEVHAPMQSRFTAMLTTEELREMCVGYAVEIAQREVAA